MRHCTLFLALLLACSEPTGIAPAGKTAKSHVNSTATVTITPDSVQIAPGATAQLTCQPRNESGAIIAGRDCKWKSLTPAIVTIGPDDFVITQTVTGQAAGVGKVWAQNGGHRDTAIVVVGGSAPPDTTTPPPPPPPAAVGCPTSGYERIVPVATFAAAQNAVNAAQPGDQIQLAPGTYSGALSITRQGTATDSLTLCGPSTAIFSGAVNITNARYWRLQGFQIRNGWIGIYAQNLDNSRIAVEISNVNQEGIQLWNGSNNNVLSGNWIHDTGKVFPQYGEAIYIGQGQSGATAAQRVADFNLIERNRIGPNVTAEHMDVKLGTQGNVVLGNFHDADGFNVIWSGGSVAALVIMDGNSQRLEADTVVNLLDSDPNNWAVFRTYAGTGTVVTKNVVVGPTTAKRFYDKDHASGTIVKCDNVKPSSLPWGTTCTN